MSMHWLVRPLGFIAAALLLAPLLHAADPKDPVGVLPVGADGKPLNLDFEDGTLKDWTATGDAFKGQPIKGDTVAARRGDMKSGHQGQYWIGGYEITKDAPVGTLASVPFKVTHRYASFLFAGGQSANTRIELATAKDNAVFFKTSGVENEQLRPFVIDLEKQQGQEIIIRLVDQHKGGWGHVNFDNFRFHDSKPEFNNVATPAAPAPAGPADQFKFAGLKPEEAAKAITLPEGFKATLFAGEPDIINPIAFTIDARGRLWVVQGMTYPVRAPEGQGKDSIIVFEDTDNDGKFDKRTVFIEKLNLVSGIEIGFGGVWVGAAPYLMFIPCDESADAPKPTGEPKILLDGWGYGDTHETMNTFCWGPDGWLYGCHGVFTQSDVGKPGAAKKDRVHLNAGIWRYHPTKHIFERFAEGMSNPWGMDFDEHGQIISEGCVIPHLWHMIQNGRYHRQAGQHDNPYTFDDIKTIADHRHYQGNTPHSGNGRSDATGGGHAHAGLLVYQGDNWPAEYRGKVFMNNIHGARINMDVLEPKGSGFVGHHGKDFCLFNDKASQIINLRTGPDGGVYMIDWYDLNQCHNGNPGAHDRTTGRIFKVTYGEPKAPAKIDFANWTTESLKFANASRNEWTARTYRRLAQEKLFRGTPLTSLALVSPGQPAPYPDNQVPLLRHLWSHSADLPDWPEKQLTDLLRMEDSPYVVGWTIQLLCEDRSPKERFVAEFSRLARESKSPVVRLYLTSAALRLPVENRPDILAGLLSHSEDAGDHNLPLMYWYGLESIADSQPEKMLAIALETKIPNILNYTVRRLSMGGGDAAMASLVGSLGTIDDAGKQLEILRGINAALKGRRSVAAPAAWADAEKKLAGSTDPQVKAEALKLAVAFGSKAALAAMRKTIEDTKATNTDRLAAIESLAGAKDAELPPILVSVLKDASLRAPAIRALASYDFAPAPAAILDVYPSLPDAEKKDALATLVSRISYATPLLSAIEAKKVDAKDLSADLRRQLAALGNKEIEQQIAKVWGTIRATPEDKLKRIAELTQLINAKGGKGPDVSHGRELFAKTCAQCHTLFGEGGKVGPDITGSNRADLAYILENVVDPNAQIPNDYRASIIDTKDDRTIVGIIKQQNEQSATVMTQNETLTLPRNEIAKLRPSELSMMPEGLLDAMAKPDIRDLIAYLRSPAQVPLSAAGAAGGETPPVQTLQPERAKPEIKAVEPKAANEKFEIFNGKDLTGWDTNGVEGLWSVDNGELVGKTEKGLKRNEFITTNYSFGDFRLVVKIKLTPDAANSGIQFHSTRTGASEMSGPQADAGKGWWGKTYGENFGNKVIGENKSGQEVVRPNEWNTYEILAVGTKIRTAINGKLCTDIEDPTYLRKGMIGLQVHSGGPTEVRFKEFEMELNPDGKLKTVKE